MQNGGISIADYGYKPETSPVLMSQTPNGLHAPVIPQRKKLLKTNRRTGSMGSTYRESENGCKFADEVKTNRNTSQKVPKQRKVSESPPFKNKREIFSGFRLFFKKSITPKPHSLQRHAIKNRNKTPGMKELELAPITRNSPKISNEAKIRLKSHL